MPQEAFQTRIIGGAKTHNATVIPADSLTKVNVKSQRNTTSISSKDNSNLSFTNMTRLLGGNCLVRRKSQYVRTITLQHMEGSLGIVKKQNPPKTSDPEELTQFLPILAQ